MSRRDERIAGETPYADEIEKVAIWGEAVARTAGIPLVLPNPLLN